MLPDPRLAAIATTRRPPAGSGLPRAAWWDRCVRLALAAIASIALSSVGPAVGTATAAPVDTAGLSTRRHSRPTSRSTDAAMATASACRSTARAVGRWPASWRRTILAHYYPKTTLGTRSTTTTIRVLLLTGLAATPAKPLRVVGLGAGWTIDGIATTFPANAKLTLSPTGAWPRPGT